MSGKYQRHDAYRDSGVLQLGEVPQDWKTKQLKRSLEGCINGIWGNEPTDSDEDIIVIRVADFDRPRLGVKEAEYTKRAVSGKERNRRLLKSGDLLLEKSGGGEKTQVGQVVLFDREFEAVCSNFVAKMTPLVGYDSSYLNYSFSALYRDGINSCSIKQNTGIQNLDSSSYLSEHWAFPCLEEQTQIAKFLDYETAKIDALIEKQQQLIALLKEKRQAVISHAVTKGLNPDAPMRDSGVEWLGEVPAHWLVRPLKRSIEPGSSISYGIVQPGEPLEDGVPFVQTTNMSSGTFDVASLQRTTKQIADAYPRSCLCGGEVVLGIRASIGAAYVVPSHLRGCNLSRGVARISLAEDLTAEYLVWYLRSATVFHYWGLSSQGSTFSEVSIETVKELYLPVPSLDEQNVISFYLAKQTSKFNELESAAEQQNLLLQERRTALISAAVTGKIDVRGWKAPESEPEAEVA